MNPTLRMLAVVTTCGVVIGLSACGRNESQTIGQSVDKSIAEAKEKGDAAKVAAEDAAKAVTAGASDAAITAKVNAALLTDADLKVMKIDVDTKNGRVILMGTAPDATALDRATAMATAVDGVTGVDNQLRSIAPKP